MSASNTNVSPMRQTTPANAQASQPQTLQPLYVLSWFLCALFYFYQYAIRSAPGIMQDELTQAWGNSHLGLMIASYYIVYALMALAIGVLLDRYGAHTTMPVGIAVTAAGCLIFAQGSVAAGIGGYIIQAVGAIGAFVGSSYVAARYLPARTLALFVGLTQCLGMAGAAFGSKPTRILIDPKGAFHVPWQTVWLGFGVIGLVLAVAVWFIMPRDSGDSAGHHGHLTIGNLLKPFRIIFSNPQSWYAGIIGGLLFVPTTIGALGWGASMLSRGEHTTMAFAASDVSMVPIGWVIGCPLLGWISDRIGRRKPVMLGGAVVLLAASLCALYVPVGVMPRYSVALVMGIASGAAMIPFSTMKEVNPPEVKGTAAGVMNFLVFGTTGILSPMVSTLMGGGADTMESFHRAFLPLVIGIVVAICLCFVVRETGWKAQRT
ncbi:MFS transporter [Tanticharoenia sakaeratensis]|uniref:Lysosomal dipeptide transporter MFSD1 n=1 Tax=Tanticharoenia sakaeratensis NBRC 103193 TaxID=1231623 RepID=A0A0D6MH88_9PROT|nr:MFS transporter [Tanticharoenia sakaeratensis]GAN52861.1 transporter [Tanticharoenia sakaeratensis NBRC 103193]GBQ18353.1 permease [Tanticharoenia sakaeratensis NBRC 103193]